MFEISGGSDVQLAGFESKNVKPSCHMVSMHKMDFETCWKLYLAGPSTSLSTGSRQAFRRAQGKPFGGPFDSSLRKLGIRSGPFDAYDTLMEAGGHE